MQLQDAPPEEPLSETPVIGGTSAERLARALGTDVSEAEDGTAAVEFPPPYGAPAPPGPFSTAPVTVARAETSDTPAPSPAPASTESSTVDVDAIAETVIDRLKRELLVEREQAGGPMDLI